MPPKTNTSKPVCDVKQDQNQDKNPNITDSNNKDNTKGSAKSARGKGRNFRKKNFREKKERRESSEHNFTNDPIYYKHNPDLLQASAQVAFSLPMGNRLKVRTRNFFGSADSVSAVAVTEGKSALPGILRVSMLPSLGTSLDEQDASSVAIKAIYSYVRHANSGSANYDSPDLMLYLLAMREVYAFAGWILRAYASLTYVNPTNRYAPDALLAAQGFDAQDLRAHIPDLKYYINYFFTQTEALYVPAELPLYRKAFEMFSRVYAEDKTGRSNWYLYKPADFLIYKATAYTTGGALISYQSDQFELVELDNFKYEDIVRLGDALLQPLLTDEDIGIMSGDIKKAYTSFFTLGSIPANIKFEPTHDSFELQVIHNITPATVRGVAPVVQFNNELCQFYIDRLASTGRMNDMTNFDVKALDIDSAVPSVDEIVEATLYKVHCELVNPTAGSRLHTYMSIAYSDDPIDGYTSKVYVNTADYIAVGSRAYRFSDTGLVDQTILPRNYLAPDNAGINNNIGILLSTFEWFPIGANYKGATAEEDYSLTWPYVGSAHNVTVVSDDTIDRLHSTVMMSLFYIPIPR